MTPYPAGKRLAADPPTGRIDLLIRWAPDAWCRYHRHLGTHDIEVLRGEQHIHERRERETVHKIRQPGFRARLTDGEVHMERAGPQGLTMLFSIHVPTAACSTSSMRRVTCC